MATHTLIFLAAAASAVGWATAAVLEPVVNRLGEAPDPGCDRGILEESTLVCCAKSCGGFQLSQPDFAGVAPRCHPT
jgi:hypothetical protein